MTSSLPAVRFNAYLGRDLRQDDPATLGRSTLLLLADAVEAKNWSLASTFLTHARQELARGLKALYSWLIDLLDQHLWNRTVSDADPGVARLLRGLLKSEPGAQAWQNATTACERQDGGEVLEHVEMARQAMLTVHTILVAWIEELLSDLASQGGDQAVFQSLQRTDRQLWAPRLEGWWALSVHDRLFITAEQARSHLSGPDRQGNVEVFTYPDRYELVLDPCGTCGALRRGAVVTSLLSAHPWTAAQADMGCFAAHVPVAFTYLPAKRGQAPPRVIKNCDTHQPCRWLVYRRPEDIPPELYVRLGLEPSQVAEDHGA